MQLFDGEIFIFITETTVWKLGKVWELQIGKSVMISLSCIIPEILHDS